LQLVVCTTGADSHDLHREPYELSEGSLYNVPFCRPLLDTSPRPPGLS
jgi:hypothetical protein